MYLFRSPRWASVKRMGYTALGAGFIIVAIIPILVPLAIAVPLAIIGSLCLAKGIPAFHRRCTQHPFFEKWMRNLVVNGPTLRQRLLAVLGATVCYILVLYFKLSELKWTIAGWCSTNICIFVPHHWLQRLMGRSEPRP